MERRNMKPEKPHLEVISTIRQMIEEAVSATQPRFGKVTGTESGKITVQFDDEAEARTVGISRVRGQRYERGQRVLLIGTGNGEWTIAGGVANTNTKNALQAVGDDEVVDGSLSGSKIKSSHVRGTRDIADNNKIITEESVETANLGSANAKGANIPTVQQIIDYAAKKSHSHNAGDLPSDVVYTPKLADYAKTSQLQGMITKSSAGTDLKDYTDKGSALETSNNSKKRLTTIQGMEDYAAKKGKYEVTKDANGKLWVQL